MKNKYPLFTFFLCLFVVTAQICYAQDQLSTPPSNCAAYGEPIVVTQPDNTTLTIVGKGNMNRYWTETVDGYTIVRNNGYYEYAEKLNGKLVASGLRVHDPAQRDIREIAAASRIQKSIQPEQVPFKGSILSQVNSQITNKNMPTTGVVKVLALLIDYPDLQSTYSTNDFDSLLNGNGYKNGDSFYSYFLKSSNGQLLIQVDVFGWYRANNNYIYYSSDSGYSRAAELVREAVDAAEIAGVDYSQYDNDSDGDVDGILAVHAGQGAEQGSQGQYIWSHRWGMAYANPGQSVTYDGKFINDYIINPETRISGFSTHMVGIGVFCHEFGHNLGIPDLYDTDDSDGNSEGLGNWCLMAGGSWLGGGDFPADFSAWSKIELNWKTATTIAPTAYGTYTLNPASQSASDIYRFNISGTPNEYFLLENRQNLGLDTFLPGTGLAIYHINTSKTWMSSGVNSDENNKGVDLEEADGLDDLDHNFNRGDAGDLYPGTSMNTAFDANGYPNSNNNSQSSSGIEIKNITESGNLITFDFGNLTTASCNGLTTLTTANGTLSDGSAASNYLNNQSCSWIIQPAGATSIDLTFSSFQTEAIHDSVTVYDGNSSSSPILGSYSGTNLPPVISSSGGAMFITFNTNASNTAQGWDASYTSHSMSFFLDAVPDTVILNAAFSSTATIPVSSNVSWSTNDNASWFQANSAFGSGNANITITALQPNIGPARFGKFYIVDAVNNISDSVVVKQLGSGKYLNATPNLLLFPVNPTKSDSIIIQANVNWTLANSPSWLTLSHTSGITDDTVTVSSSNNTSNLSRIGSIDVQGTGGVSSQSVVVFQAGPLYVSPTNISLNANPASFKASSDNQTPITATSPQGWLSTLKSTIAGISGNPDTSLFQVIAQVNNTGTSRNGIIVVDDTWSKDTVYINQSPSSNFVNTSPDTVHFNVNGGLASFDVFSDTTWQISGTGSFYTLNKTNGIYNDDVDVLAAANPNTSPREEMLYVSAVNDPSVKDSVLVFQEGVSPYYLTVNKNSIALGFTASSIDSLEINSNVNWNVSYGSSWLSVNPSSGTGFTKMMIATLSDNLSGSNRKDTLVFSAPNHADVKVEVVQLDGAAPSFDVSTDTVYLQDFQGSKGVFSILSNQSWTISENTPWLILNPLSGNGVMDIDLMAASKNILGNERAAKVIVSSPGFMDEEVTVIQLGSAPLLSVSKDSLMMPSDSGRTESFSISSNLNLWNISTNASWIDISPTSGGFTQLIEITTIDSNDTKSIRVDSLEITSPPHVPIHVKILQDTAMLVGIEEFILDNQLKVYPNPVRDILTVEFDSEINTSDVRLELFNAIGEKVDADQRKYEGEIQLDVSALQGGFYFLQLSNGKSSLTKIISVVGQF